MAPDDDKGPGFALPPNSSRNVVSTQLLLATTLGVSALLSFCLLRSRWPQFYAARKARRKGLPKLASGTFGWLKSLYDITEDEVLEHAGLDAFVFLGFFKMAIQLFSICTICAVTIIGPIRLHFTGTYDPDDGDDDNAQYLAKRFNPDDPPVPEDYAGYLWVYVIFTYVFTALTAVMLMRQTYKVVRVRQEYLGRQNSITDRTIRLAGIPHDLRTEEALKEHVESLNIGTVRSVRLCRNWHALDELFDEREEVVEKLERAWSEYLGPTWATEHPEQLPYTTSRISLSNMSNDSEESDERASLLGESPSRSGTIQVCTNLGQTFVRPTEKTGFLGLFGRQVDVLDEYSNRLEGIDERIRQLRSDEDSFPPTGSAFVTMDSVASAQMTGQAVLDPRPHKLIAETAPAPHDVVWRNLYMTTRERIFRTYSITLVIGIFTMFMVAVVSYLAWFVSYDVIEKYWPAMAKFITEHSWASTALPLLPTWLFSFLTGTVPFIYAWLSTKQGFVSHGEVELSSISKNYFFLFFNMFLVFTVASGAISSYWRFLRDTTQIAYELARTLTGLSTFYVNLIILQGLGMFPFRLLQIGNLSRFPWIVVRAKSPRDHRNLYKPAIFNYGVTLPQPMLVFVIVVLYSVISTKILVFGTLYFVAGYFTYKYQLIYSMVHPQHSTGRAWPLIFRRISMGLIVFHLTMAGILALKHAYFLATILAPLPFVILGQWWNFEENYVPLLQYIALRAIETTGSQAASVVLSEPRPYYGSIGRSDTLGSVRRNGSMRRRGSQNKTLDEQRERFLRYVNPNMARALDGPWIGIEGDEVIVANHEGTVRKRMRFEEWE